MARAPAPREAPAEASAPRVPPAPAPLAATAVPRWAARRHVQPPPSGLTIFDPSRCAQGQTSVGAVAGAAPVAHRIQQHGPRPRPRPDDTQPAEPVRHRAEDHRRQLQHQQLRRRSPGRSSTSSTWRRRDAGRDAVSTATAHRRCSPPRPAGPRTPPARRRSSPPSPTAPSAASSTARESAALHALYTDVSAQFDFATGIQAVIDRGAHLAALPVRARVRPAGRRRRRRSRWRRWSWPRACRSTCGDRCPTRR